MTGTCGLDGYGGACSVTDFADHNHIWRLAEDALQSFLKRTGVHADLSLVYVAHFMLMVILDRVLYGYYIGMPPGVYGVHKRRQCCRVPLTGRAADEDEPVGPEGIFLKLGRQTELGRRWNFIHDDPDGK